MIEFEIPAQFGVSKNRSVLHLPDDGVLTPELSAEMSRVELAGNDADVVLVTTVGSLQLLERVGREDPSYLREAMDNGDVPSGVLEYDFSIRMDVLGIWHRTSGLTQDQVVQFLDLMHRLSFRSAREFSRAFASQCPNRTPSEDWNPTILPMFEPEDDEIICGSWTMFSQKDVELWHRDLLRWIRSALLPMAEQVGLALLRRWDRQLLQALHCARH